MNALKLRSCFNNVPEHEELSRLNCKKPSIIFARSKGSCNNRVSSFPNLHCFFFAHTSIALQREKHILRVRSTPVRTMCAVLCLHFILPSSYLKYLARCRPWVGYLLSEFLITFISSFVSSNVIIGENNAIIMLPLTLLIIQSFFFSHVYRAVHHSPSYCLSIAKP